MRGLSDLGFSICIAASTGKEHPLVMEADIIDKRKLIIRNSLLKCPEEIIGCHQERTVFDGIFLIASERRVSIFFRNTVKPLNKCLNS